MGHNLFSKLGFKMQIWRSSQSVQILSEKESFMKLDKYHYCFSLSKLARFYEANKKMSRIFDKNLLKYFTWNVDRNKINWRKKKFSTSCLKMSTFREYAFFEIQKLQRQKGLNQIESWKNSSSIHPLGWALISYCQIISKQLLWHFSWCWYFAAS